MTDLVAAYWFNPDLEARWEPMGQTQQIFANDRPLITLVGANSIQAFRNGCFEFPMGTFDVAYGRFHPQNLFQAVVK